MLILSIDTTGPDCAACIFDGVQQKILAERSETIGRGHAEHLPRITEYVLSTANVEFSDLTHIAVTHGPGSFAGIRVGISFARALSLALNIPSIGLSSLHALGFDEVRKTQKETLVLLDARRGEIFTTFVSSTGDIVTDAQAQPIDRVKQMIEQNSVQLCGNGINVILEKTDLKIPDTHICHQNASPTIESVARLALKFIELGKGGKPKPLYLRQADAKPNVNFAVERQI